MFYDDAFCGEVESIFNEDVFCREVVSTLVNMYNGDYKLQFDDVIYFKPGCVECYLVKGNGVSYKVVCSKVPSVEDVLNGSDYVCGEEIFVPEYLFAVQPFWFLASDFGEKASYDDDFPDEIALEKAYRVSECTSYMDLVFVIDGVTYTVKQDTEVFIPTYCINFVGDTYSYEENLLEEVFSADMESYSMREVVFDVIRVGLKALSSILSMDLCFVKMCMSDEDDYLTIFPGNMGEITFNVDDKGVSINNSTYISRGDDFYFNYELDKLMTMYEVVKSVGLDVLDLEGKSLNYTREFIDQITDEDYQLK